MSRLRTHQLYLWLIAAFSLAILLIAAALAWAGVGFQATRLTDNSFTDYPPRISGSNVVWDGAGGPGGTTEIYLHDGSAVTTLTANLFNEYDARISGANVVWLREAGGTTEIDFYNGSTVTTLTANTYDDDSAEISGGNVVWRGWNGTGGTTTEIYFYNGSIVTTLTANSYNEYTPQISGNNVVWSGYGGPGNTGEILLYNGSMITTLTANIYNDYEPQISGDNVVWSGYGGPGNTTEIYFYNGSTVTTLTANSFDDDSPQISGSNVVWQGAGGPGNTNEIYFYNGSTVTTLTANSFNDNSPQISGNSIVWSGYGGPGVTSEIYFYEGSTVTPLTDNSFNDYSPRISGDNVVWQGDGEIYLARLDRFLPTDPFVLSSTPVKDVWTSGNVILVNFSGAADVGAGVDGFSFEWSGSPTTVPDAAKDLEESAAAALSPAQPDGDRWFHLRTRDNAGNWTSTIHYGPFKIDTTKPTALVRAPRSVVASGATARFRVSWRGADAASGVKNFDVRYRIGKRGKWKAWKTGVSALKARFTAKTGKTYFFRARARDKAGNVGAWSKSKRTIVN